MNFTPSYTNKVTLRTLCLVKYKYFAGSLGPTFVSARPVSLAVKLPYALTLYNRFPTGLREP